MIDIAPRTDTDFIGIPASDSSGGSNTEAKPVFESSVPGGGSPIDDWDRLSSDTLKPRQEHTLDNQNERNALD